MTTVLQASVTFRSLLRCSRALLALMLFALQSCIEPPLKLPAEEVIVDMPIVVAELEVVWNLNIDWDAQWHYGWDEYDDELFGEVTYPTPTSFEVRRYFLGNKPRVPHTVVDAFPIYSTSFRRTYEFGYYDMLIWSHINSKTQTQVVTIDESNLDDTYASTTVTRAISINRVDEEKPTALYNQPEIFYSAYPRDIYISRNKEDYDYYNEEERVWVKHINCTLNPLVYIYLVQIVVLNNDDGRVRGISGDCAISAMASATNVNTAHTLNSPCMVYFNTRMKKNIMVDGHRTDIIGGKLTTYGLCDMDGFSSDSRAVYHGSRGELPNYLYFDLVMSGGSVQTMRAEVTEQCQTQCHGGIITIYLDAATVDNPTGGEPGQGSLFHPTVEDYTELEYDIPM